MKLYIIFTAILAISLAEEVKKEEDTLTDFDSVASLELLKTGQDTQEALKTAASSYPSASVKKQKSYNSGSWQNNQENNYPQNNYPQNNPQYNYPQNNYPQNNYPQNNYPQNNYPQNNYPQNNYPQNNYPQNNNPHHDIPQSSYPPKNPQHVTHDYYPSPTTTTTQVAIIKNDHIIGDYGSYKYEYEIADGTHVGEEGYLLNPHTDNEIPVKQGWYSFKANDGVVYTVRWWADASGFHAEGAHLPTPPPIPKAIQAGLDLIAEEEKKKQQQKPIHDAPFDVPTKEPVYYPTEKPTYHPTYATQKPTYYPTQKPTYYPTQKPTYYPTQKPTYYPTQKPTYYPTDKPTYYPTSSAPNYNQENSGYYPQQGYNQQQQNNPEQSYYAQAGYNNQAQ